jgi:hypothetical protein
MDYSRINPESSVWIVAGETESIQEYCLGKTPLTIGKRWTIDIL